MFWYKLASPVGKQRNICADYDFFQAMFPGSIGKPGNMVSATTAGGGGGGGVRACFARTIFDRDIMVTTYCSGYSLYDRLDGFP